SGLYLLTAGVTESTLAAQSESALKPICAPPRLSCAPRSPTPYVKRQPMKDTSGIHARPRPLRRVLVAVLSTMGLAVAAATAATLPANASAPTPPSGWNQVFLDDFNGAAGTGVNTGDWQYDTGTSYPGAAANWGTGEVETMTSSTSNVALDGNGNLVIT